MRYYKLVNRVPVPVPGLLEWGSWFATSDRTVAKSEITHPVLDKVLVSTVFLGLDLNYSAVGPPVLFETMVFGGPLDEMQYRYCTWDDAIRGHNMCMDEALIEGKLVAAEVDAKVRALLTKWQRTEGHGH